MPGQILRLKVTNPSLISLITERGILPASGKSSPTTKGSLSLAVVTVVSEKPETEQEDGGVNALSGKDLHEVGCAVRVLRAEKAKDTAERLTVWLEGVARVRLRNFVRTPLWSYLVASADVMTEPGECYLPTPHHHLLIIVDNRFLRGGVRWLRKPG